MKKIPPYISQYLWDVPLHKLTPEKDADFIIERILEYGDEKAVKWMNRSYLKGQIIKVLSESKKISPKSGNFYALYYGVPKESLLCIRKPFTQKQDRF